MIFMMEDPDPTFSQPASDFLVDSDDKIIAKSQKNIRVALQKLDVTLRYDEFHDRMLITGLQGYSSLSDAAIHKLWLTIDEQFRFLPPLDFFLIVVDETARRNSFHPVREYLDGLKWDGTARLDNWLVTYGKAEDTEYAKVVGALSLVAAVRRVRKPGCKFDEMLILESPQGTNKSKMLQIMAVCPEWFCDDLPLGADGKRVIEQTRGKWIVEAAELSGMRRAEVAHLKAMLSRQYDRGRMAYGRVTTEMPRQFIIFGTTNDHVYLRDLTGNRRFWPLQVKEFDIDVIERDRDQLWAEAAQREATGVSIRLQQKLWTVAGEQQDQRMVHDPWRELLTDLLDGMNGKVQTTDLWNALGVDAERRTQEQNYRLGSAMKAMGFERKILKFEGKNRRCYVRGSLEEQEVEIELPM
jgi:predicted P-loop ATPase